MAHVKEELLEAVGTVLGLCTDGAARWGINLNLFDRLPCVMPVRRCLSNDGVGDAANLVRIRWMQPGSKSGC